MKLVFVFSIILSFTISSKALSSTAAVPQICGAVEVSQCKAIIDKVFATINKELATATRHDLSIKPKSEPTDDFDSMRFLRSGLMLTSSMGYTNSTGTTDDSATSSIDAKIEDTTTGEIKFGYFGKEVKDIWKLLENDRSFNFEDDGWFENYVLEKLKVDLWAGYGHSLTDPKGNNNFKVKTEEKYYVGLKYEMKFDEKWHP